MTVPRQFRAPRQHGAVLADPPLDECGEVLSDNQARIRRFTIDLLGRPFADLRRAARRFTLAAAREYLQGRAELAPPLSDALPDRFLMAGHQPELFHPGVWVKNFALNGQARRHSAVAVNLVIDTDSAKPPVLRLPTWDGEGPVPASDPAKLRLASVPYDRWTKEVAYEDRPVLDDRFFQSLPVRVAPLIRGWNFEPLLVRFWDEVIRQGATTDLLGERLAGARRALENRWGCANWEVPMSRLCGGEPFIWFACHLLAHLPRFRDVYNASVRDYRRANGVPSDSRPVPDLAAHGDWLETPLWAWHRDHSRRGRLFARVGPGTVALRVGETAGPTLPLRIAGDPSGAIAAWREWEAAGFRVRSRALTTTLFARLFVADLFTHGIGGGKYDEITDDIIRRFYGFEPPHYQVLSATLLLPFAGYSASDQDCRRLAAAVRDAYWNPQRHLPAGIASDPAPVRLASEKRNLAARRPADPAGRREWFRRLRSLTEELRGLLGGQLSELTTRLKTCREASRANAILQRRDYAFCLYPETMLREFLTAFL